MQYRVTVYQLEYADHNDGYEFHESLRDQAEDAPALPSLYEFALVQIGSVLVEAEDDRYAAAKGWVALVGRERMRHALEVTASAWFAERYIDLRAIAGGLHDSCIGPLGWQLDEPGRADHWVMALEAIPAPGGQPQPRISPTPVERWLDRRIDPWDVRDVLQQPSAN